MMAMSVAERCLRVYKWADPHLAAPASKLARTFAIQTETLAKLRGRRVSRQKITVAYQKHEHQHVHVHRGTEKTGGQPHATEAVAPVRPLLSADPSIEALPGTGSEGQTSLPDARRRKRLRGPLKGPLTGLGSSVGRHKRR